MVQNLEEVMAKIKSIKGEMDVVEYRVLNTRTHVEQIEGSVAKISKEVIEGFHTVSGKVNRLEEHLMQKIGRLEEIIIKLEGEVEQLIKKNS